MEWMITLNEEGQYAEIVTSGIVDKDGTREMAKAISVVLSKAKIKKILIDHRNVSAVSGGILDIYQRPKELEEFGAVRGIHVAEVVKEEHNEFFSFLETVCVNRGYIFSIFNDKKSALGWLLSS
jgi:hypothetical protein